MGILDHDSSPEGYQHQQFVVGKICETGEFKARSKQLIGVATLQTQ